jgi:hypothetical protein
MVDVQLLNPILVVQYANHHFLFEILPPHTNQWQAVPFNMPFRMAAGAFLYIARIRFMSFLSEGLTDLLTFFASN